MERNIWSILAGCMFFCVTHHRFNACPICLDKDGNVKRPFFHDAELENNEKEQDNVAQNSEKSNE